MVSTLPIIWKQTVGVGGRVSAPSGSGCGIAAPISRKSRVATLTHGGIVKRVGGLELVVFRVADHGRRQRIEREEIGHLHEFPISDELYTCARS